MAVPNLPFDEYRACAFQSSKHREMAYVVFSLAYGTFLLLSTAHLQRSDAFCVKDVFASVIIVYSAKRYVGCPTRVGVVPSLLDKIREDATIYCLVVSTGHVLFLFFQVFAPVSDPVNLRSTAHDKLHTGSDETSSWGVSPGPKYCNGG